MTQFSERSFSGRPGEWAGEEVAVRGMSIGEYLIQRLQDYGLRDLFGIPGDYILNLYGMLELSPIRVVGCTREDCAGFAADAYARINGLGAVCVTYCVGGLSVCNSIAGAYAEKSPVVMITGSPGLAERVNNPLLHHKVRDFRTQLEVFEKLCCASTEVSDPVNAFREIDRVLDAAVRFKRPVYIDIPRDLVDLVPHVTHTYQRSRWQTDPLVLAEAVDEAVSLLKKAQQPVIIAGVEVHRFGLQDQVLELAEGSQIPMAATLLGKSVVSEKHPLYLGLYEGAMGHEAVTNYVESSDCILLLGAFMTDINLGIYTANIDPAKCIYVTSESLRIRHHHYRGVPLDDFLAELNRRKPSRKSPELPTKPSSKTQPFEVQSNQPITISRMIARLNEQLDADTIVIADIGDALFAATELVIHQRTDFLSPAYYTSMGFSVPAALGACVAKPSDRVVVICGDGAFQMTGMELSTIVRHGFSPIVIVLDNHGYGTERTLHPGEWSYNEIHGWDYAELPKIFRGGRGFRVETEEEFDRTLDAVWDDRSEMSLLHVKLPEGDQSETLKRLAERLGKRV